MSNEFHAPWKTYDILEMDRHELDNGVVYISHDRTCVFVERGDDLTGRKLRRADEEEITELWQKHRLVALLSVFQRMVYLTAGVTGSGVASELRDA
jgi:hypothetical protein